MFCKFILVVLLFFCFTLFKVHRIPSIVNQFPFCLGIYIFYQYFKTFPTYDSYIFHYIFFNISFLNFHFPLFFWSTDILAFLRRRKSIRRSRGYLRVWINFVFYAFSDIYFRYFRCCFTIKPPPCLCHFSNYFICIFFQ